MTHTDCSHDRTAAGRRGCRAAKIKAIREAQAAYMGTQDGTFDRREYNAMIELMTGRWFDTMTEAYTVVEHGPIL